MVEARLLQRVASEYVGRGYRVELEPLPQDLPPPLTGLRVDLLARKDDETLVVEVRAPHEAPHQNWERLLVGARELGWRVALHPMSQMEASEPLSPEGLQHMLDAAERLLDNGLADGAVLLGWSAAEAVLLRMAQGIGDEPEAWPAGRLLRELTAAGRLSHAEFALLDACWEARTVLAHGRMPLRATEADDVYAMLALVRWYATHPELTAEKMAWRLAEHEVLVENVELRFPGVPALLRDQVLELLRRH